jgi:hypothetical protein
MRRLPQLAFDHAEMVRTVRKRVAAEVAYALAAGGDRSLHAP